MGTLWNSNIDLLFWIKNYNYRLFLTFWLVKVMKFWNLTLNVDVLSDGKIDLMFWMDIFSFWVLSNHPCPSVRGPLVRPSLNISETAHWFFLIFCMKLEHHKGTQMTEPDFWKKSWGVTNWGKPSFLGYFWCFLSVSLHPVI